MALCEGDSVASFGGVGGMLCGFRHEISAVLVIVSMGS